MDKKATISNEDAKKYAMLVLRHFGVKKTSFVRSGSFYGTCFRLANGDYGIAFREKGGMTWEPVVIKKGCCRSRWRQFVEDWLWSLTSSRDSLGIDSHLERKPHEGPEPDMVYTPVMKPLSSRDLTSLKIELDLLGDKSNEVGFNE